MAPVEVPESAVLAENAELKALLETTLNALEAARAEAGHAGHAAAVEKQRASALQEALALRDATTSLQADRLHSAAQQSTQAQRGEQVETEYSLISSSVELHATRQKLVVATRQLVDAKDDISQLHSEYDVVTHQLLAEQCARAAAEADARMLRQQLGDAAQGLLQSAHNLGELKALVVSLQGSLADARAEGGRVHAALLAAEARVHTLEASGDTRVREVEAQVAQLRADLASSRESAEALRRDLRVTQADGEGRARERDESTRNLRNELRDADETIGALRQQLRSLQAHGPLPAPHAGPSVAAAPAPPAPAPRGRKPANATAVKTPAAAKKVAERGVTPKAKALPAPSLPEAPPLAPAAPVAGHVDIEVPFVAPAGDDSDVPSDGDSDFDLAPVAKKRGAAAAKSQPAARSRPRKAAAAPAKQAGAAGGSDAAPVDEEVPAPAEPVVPSQPPSQPGAEAVPRALGTLSGNVQPRAEGAGGVAPKKRKLLGGPAAGSVDTMPPSFLLSMMGSFAAPKLRTAL